MLEDTTSTTRNSRDRTQRETGRYLASRDQPPQSDEQLASQRHDHGLAGRTAGVCGARAEPLRQGAILLEADKAPGEFNHAAAHPRLAGSRQTFLPPPGPAFVRRPGKTGIAGHGSSVSQIAR